MPNNVQAAVVAYVQSKIGQPYKYGGTPNGGPTDCSGLAEEAYASAGVTIPRTSETQWTWCQQNGYTTSIPSAGDLIFTAGSDGTLASPGHVGIYIGGGSVIQDPYTGASVDIISVALFGPLAGIGEPWRAAGGASSSPGATSAAAMGCLPSLLLPWRLFKRG